MLAEIYNLATPLLLGIVAFFLLRLITQLDKNTVACATLSVSIGELSSNMRSIEDDVHTQGGEIRDLWDEVRYQSDRSHAVVNQVTKLGSAMNRGGLGFDPEWDVPQRNHRKN